MSEPDGSAPYINAVVLGTIIAAVTVLGILYLRPQSDPITLLASVGGLAVIVTGQAILFIKAHETGVKVDGQLTQWKDENSRMARAEGVIQGAAVEQARVAEQKATAAIVAQQVASAAKEKG